MTNCPHCGLPPDLCACVKHNGDLVTFEEHRKIHGLGIIAPHRIYYCTKCRQDVSWSMTETFTCPCCGRSGLRHKGECQGIVIEKDPFKLPILY